MNETKESQTGRVTRREWGLLIGPPYVIMAFFFLPRVLGWDLRGTLSKTWFVVGFVLIALYAIGGAIIIGRRWFYTWRDFGAKGHKRGREPSQDPRGL